MSSSTRGVRRRPGRGTVTVETLLIIVPLMFFIFMLSAIHDRWTLSLIHI